MSVRLFKTRTCAVCHLVKNKLNEWGVQDIAEFYIDDDPKLQQYVWDKSGGFLQVPFTVVVDNEGNEHYVSGGNLSRLKELVI